MSWKFGEELRNWQEVFERVEVLRKKDHDLSHGDGEFGMHYRAQGVDELFLSPFLITGLKSLFFKRYALRKYFRKYFL